MHSRRRDVKDRTVFFVKYKHLTFSDDIFEYLEQRVSGVSILVRKIVLIAGGVWNEFYPHVGEAYPEELRAMAQDFDGKPVDLAILGGTNIVGRVKRVVGPTKFEDNPTGTIRRRWGPYELPHTIVHASDSEEDVEREIGILVKYGVLRDNGKI